MKLIIAIIQPEELPEIKEELLKNKIYKFTVSNALGQGKEVYSSFGLGGTGSMEGLFFPLTLGQSQPSL